MHRQKRLFRINHIKKKYIYFTSTIILIENNIKKYIIRISLILTRKRREKYIVFERAKHFLVKKKETIKQ